MYHHRHNTVQAVLACSHPYIFTIHVHNFRYFPVSAILQSTNSELRHTSMRYTKQEPYRRRLTVLASWYDGSWLKGLLQRLTWVRWSDTSSLTTNSGCTLLRVTSKHCTFHTHAHTHLLAATVLRRCLSSFVTMYFNINLSIPSQNAFNTESLSWELCFRYPKTILRIWLAKSLPSFMWCKWSSTIAMTTAHMTVTWYWETWLKASGVRFLVRYRQRAALTRGATELFESSKTYNKPWRQASYRKGIGRSS